MVSVRCITHQPSVVSPIFAHSMCSEWHFSYNYITKRLVWADNMFYAPEQLVDSDVAAREGSVSLGESP